MRQDEEQARTTVKPRRAVPKFDPVLNDEIWCAGSASAIVREEVLQSFLHAESISGAGVSGVASKAHRIRQEKANELIIEDEGDVPDSLVLEHRLSCWEAHPGLCAGRDSDVYSNSLLLASSLEKCLDSSLMHQFFALHTPDETAHRAGFNTLYLYFCWTRQRAPYNQTTHVVIKCEVIDEDTEDNVFGLTLGSVNPRIWDYRTLWSVAAYVLRLKWHEINVLQLDWETEESSDDRIIFTVSDELPRKVWPRMYARPPRERHDGPRLDGEPRGRRSKRQTAGVRLIRPVGAPLQCPGGPGADIVVGDGSDSSDTADGAPVADPNNMGRNRVRRPQEPPPGSAYPHQPPLVAGPDAPGIANDASSAQVEAPPQPHPQKRGVTLWGPFTLHELSGGGLSAHCDLHRDCNANGDKCRTSLLCGSGVQALTLEEVSLRLKRWLIFGLLYLPQDDETSRFKHIFENKARKFTENPTTTDLTALPPGMFTDEELACLQ